MRCFGGTGGTRPRGVDFQMKDIDAVRLPLSGQHCVTFVQFTLFNLYGNYISLENSFRLEK